MLRRARVALAVLACSVGLPAGAADASHDVLAAVDAYATRQAEVGQQLWAQPELGYLETRSSALLQDELRRPVFASTPVWQACLPRSWPATASAATDR